MSSSTVEVVKTTTGIRRSCGSALISLEGFPAVFAGHFEIQENQIRAGRGAAVFVLPAMPQVVEQFFAVANEAKIVRLARLAQCIADQLAILSVVVGHQNRAPFAGFDHW